MKRRFRLTGFARFFVVMLFIVPLAYMGASYYNGEDGIQNLKNLLGIGKEKITSETGPNNPGSGFQNAPSTDIQQLKARVEALEKENRDLKVKIRDLDLELKATKLQLERSRSGG